MRFAAILQAVLLHADDSNFDAMVSQGLTLVEFSTPTCGPCREILPHLKKLAQEVSGRMRVVKVDATQAPQAAADFGVRMVPYFLLFNNGQAVHAIQGNPGPKRLREFAYSAFQ